MRKIFHFIYIPYAAYIGWFKKFRGNYQKNLPFKNDGVLITPIITLFALKRLLCYYSVVMKDFGFLVLTEFDWKINVILHCDKLHGRQGAVAGN